MHIVYVTGGTVGVGDLMHGVALRAAARRAGNRARVTLVSPPLPFPALQHLDDHITVEMRAQTLLDPKRADQTPLCQTLQALRADVVVVGHFWANVHFILPTLTAKAVLLLRKAPPVWVVGPPIAPFSSTRRHYKHIFEIEPVGFAGDFEHLPPLVVANRDELLSASAARRALLGDDDDGRPLRLVFQAGRAGEAASLCPAPDDTWRTLVCDLHAPSSSTSRPVNYLNDNDYFGPERPNPWPMAPLLNGADEIVTGAGYNAWWETQWLGQAHKTRWVPFARSIDDQAWRMSLTTTAMAENGADVLLQLLERW